MDDWSCHCLMTKANLQACLGCLFLPPFKQKAMPSRISNLCNAQIWIVLLTGVIGIQRGKEYMLNQA